MSDRLNVDETLGPDEARNSNNGSARLVFQSDGNLVLYVARPRVGWVARWASNTAGQPGVRCVMQGDGNLVIYDAGGRAIWASNTHGNPGASIVVQDDENVVLYGPAGNALWSSDTWVGGWVNTSFDIPSSGLRFSNSFGDANILGIPLAGLCGGMSFTALDYHYAGRAASRLKDPPSTESNPLGGYIKGRHIQSLANEAGVGVSILLAFLGIPVFDLAGAVAGLVPSYNLKQFILMANAPSEVLRKRSFGEEFGKLRAAIDAGKPLPLGLISPGGLGQLTKSHQLVATGYRDGKRDRWIRVFDQNHPSRFHELWISEDHDIEQTNGETWRGVFVEEYVPGTPPRVGIDESVATDRRVFDPDVYLRLHGDLMDAFKGDTASAKIHWLSHGTREMRRAGLLFDASYYIATYNDLRAAFGSDNAESAIEHWIGNGIGEGRRSSLEFDVRWYLANHQDLVDAFGATNYAAALQHFIDNGLSEGRRSSADFDVAYYLGAHDDLVRAFGPTNYAAAFEHWIANGRAEGRRAIP